MAELDHKTHRDYQQRYFDKNAECFMRPLPAEVGERMHAIVAAAGVSADSRILDAGTGTGALIQYMLAAGARPENIVGCDLSERMLAEAKGTYGQVQFWQGDVTCLPDSFGLFDIAFFNGCFGNMLDQAQALKVTSRHLSGGGRVVLSHPMGRRFVAMLHEQEPQLVPNLLPDSSGLAELARSADLLFDAESFRDDPYLYVAVLRRGSP